jgi:enediyne polyketide synthase
MTHSLANVLLISDNPNSAVTKALSDRLLALEVVTKKVTYDEVNDHVFKNSYSHYLAILPEPPFSTESSLPLAQMVERLKSIATAPKDSCIAYIQFGNLQECDSTRIEPQSLCATAFARSVHLERSDLKVRVITLAPELQPASIADSAIAELAGDEAIVTVSYDANSVRFVPKSRLQQPINYIERSLFWSETDVILVTGGAKGITAECALALARSQKAKMALVGRSQLSNSEVTLTLERFQAEGLTCRYYSCDITNIDAVTELVGQITAELGTITGVIHGAGLNQPRRVEQIGTAKAIAETAPKLLGADNLLRVLAATPPKLFMAFSSIIGVTGMPGNAWYAFANETLELMLRRFAAEHLETQVISLAYSVWGEVGMGARMGSVKNLARMGINAIPTSEGINRFLKLFTHDPGVKQVVITARLNGFDTWTPISAPLPTGLRFIEKVVYLEPGVELTARTRLTLDLDLYVRDHLWRGSYLFPTVFGLEAMAQATAHVMGERRPTIICIEDISLRQPIVVNPSSGIEIEIHAEVGEIDINGEQAVRVGISTETTGFKTDCFAATLVLGKPTFGETITPKLAKKLTLEPKKDLYGGLLFQGKRFQRMGDIFTLDSQCSVFRSFVVSEAELLTESFAPDSGKSILLGDPYFRDVMLQSVQLTIPQHICLPVQIAKIELFANPNSEQSDRLVYVELQQLEGREYISEVVATNERGAILERLSGYRLRILEEHPENPTALELVDPQERDRAKLKQVIEGACQQLNLTVPTITLEYLPNLQSQPKQQRRTLELPIINRALKERLGLTAEDKLDFQLQTLDSGKPKLTGSAIAGLDLSLAHCDRYCLCVIGETAQGCDIESIQPRDREDWIALLSFKRNSLLEELFQRGDPLDRAGTRIWSALEAVRKAFNGSQPQFTILAKEGNSVLLKCQNTNCVVLTVPVALTRPPERMVAIVVTQVEPTTSKSSDRHYTRYIQNGPQGQLVYEQRFQASFKDSGSISRQVHFPQYFRWIGKLRELPMESIAPQMLSDFLSGDWGMVTNAVSLRVLGEATAYDTIQGRVWVGDVVNSSFDTYLEFCKVLPDHSLARIAIAKVKATWVGLVGYGVPSPMPFPAYLQQYLAKFAPQKPASLDLRKPATLPLPPLPASLVDLDGGAEVKCVPAQSRYGRLLREEVFQTTLEESNLVGNVYYANYFIWQGRILDLFLYSIAPQYLRVSHPRGEIVCLYTRMDYLREAMPFDRIRTLLYLASVSERGAIYKFEFFREYPDGKKEKLHVGEQEVLWVMRDADGTPHSASWPPEILQALTGVEISSEQQVVAFGDRDSN